MSLLIPPSSGFSRPTRARCRWWWVTHCRGRFGPASVLIWLENTLARGVQSKRQSDSFSLSSLKVGLPSFFWMPSPQDCLCPSLSSDQARRVADLVTRCVDLHDDATGHKVMCRTGFLQGTWPRVRLVTGLRTFPPMMSGRKAHCGLGPTFAEGDTS